MMRARNVLLRLAAVLALTLVAAKSPATQPAGRRAAIATPAYSKPKVRAITAFVRLDRAQYRTQIQGALVFLRQAKSAFEKAGYEVQTIRITTQPFPEYTRDLSPNDTIAFFREYNALAVKEGFDASIGPAMQSDNDDPREAELLAKIIVATTTLEGSVVMADEDKIHWKSLRAAAAVIQYLSTHTPHSQGNFNFAATALVPSGTPFYPASYYSGVGNSFAVGLQSANIVADVFRQYHDPDSAEQALKEALSTEAKSIEAIGRSVEADTGWIYGGLDLSPAPLKDVSIGEAIENFTGAPFGSSGTMTAAAMITRAIRAVPEPKVGYSGLMLPVLEDSVLSKRWTEGLINMDSLLAYSSVCGTGLDVIPLPGDISQDHIVRILSDVASLAVKWRKPLSARLLPVAGKKPGELTEFDDPYLVNAKIQPLP